MSNITKVYVNLVKNTESSLVGFASITLDDEIVIKGLRIIEGKNGLFVAYPSTYSEKDETYYDDVFPISKECREYIETEVLDAYFDKVNKEDDECDKKSTKSNVKSRKTPSKRR